MQQLLTSVKSRTYCMSLNFQYEINLCDLCNLTISLCLLWFEMPLCEIFVAHKDQSFDAVKIYAAGVPVPRAAHHILTCHWIFRPLVISVSSLYAPEFQSHVNVWFFHWYWSTSRKVTSFCIWAKSDVVVIDLSFSVQNNFNLYSWFPKIAIWNQANYGVRVCLVGEKIGFWYCSTFHCYLTNNIQL